MLLTLAGKERCSYLEDVVDAHGGLQRGVEAVGIDSSDVALLIVVAYRGIVCGFVASAADAEAVFLSECCAHEDVVPVGVDIAKAVDALLRLWGESSPPSCLVAIHFAHGREDSVDISFVFAEGVVGVQEVEFEVDLLVAVEEVESIKVDVGAACELGVEVDDGCSSLTSLSGDDDDAIGSSRAIDSCGCGILEHSDALDVSRVDASDACLVEVVYVFQLVGGGHVCAFKRYAVEHPQGVLASVDA